MSNRAAALIYARAAHLAATLDHPRLTVLGAVNDPALARLCATTERCALRQNDRRAANELARAGLVSTPEPDVDAPDLDLDLALVLPAGQRLETLGRLGRAALALRDGGRMLFCCPNDLGARGYERRLHELAPGAHSQSKAKCRCVEIARDGETDMALARRWVEESGPRRVPALGLISQPGLFSWDRPDPGSTLLLETLPDDLAGRGMDLGCGNGFLSRALLARCPGVETLHLVDVDHRALACARANLEGASTAQLAFHWRDAAAEPLPGELDFVLLNPPFHSGGRRDTGLGARLVEIACDALRPGGRLLLVANRQMPYERALRARLTRFEETRVAGGYKVIAGRR